MTSTEASRRVAAIPASPSRGTAAEAQACEADPGPESPGPVGHGPGSGDEEVPHSAGPGETQDRASAPQCQAGQGMAGALWERPTLLGRSRRHSKSARSPYADHDTERLSGRGCRGTPWHACVHTHAHAPQHQVKDRCGYTRTREGRLRQEALLETKKGISDIKRFNPPRNVMVLRWFALRKVISNHLIQK